MSIPVAVRDLQEQDRFQVPLGYDRGGMKVQVLKVEKSLMQADHTRITTTKKTVSNRFVILPDDLVVDVFERNNKPVVSVKKCTCTNHMGSKKQVFSSREIALQQIVRRHMSHGSHRVYPCPTEEGKFHITSQKEKK